MEDGVGPGGDLLTVDGASDTGAGGIGGSEEGAGGVGAGGIEEGAGGSGAGGSDIASPVRN